jgi:hypothetical protein
MTTESSMKQNDRAHCDKSAPPVGFMRINAGIKEVGGTTEMGNRQYVMIKATEVVSYAMNSSGKYVYINGSFATGGMLTQYTTIQAFEDEYAKNV